MSTIYNTTDGPLIIDRAGRVLGSREHRDDVDVTSSPLAGHIAAGRVLVMDDAEQPAEAPAEEPTVEETTELEVPDGDSTTTVTTTTRSRKGSASTSSQEA